MIGCCIVLRGTGPTHMAQERDLTRCRESFVLPWKPDSKAQIWFRASVRFHGNRAGDLLLNSRKVRRSVWRMQKNMKQFQCLNFWRMLEFRRIIDWNLSFNVSFLKCVFKASNRHLISLQVCRCMPSDSYYFPLSPLHAHKALQYDQTPWEIKLLKMKPFLFHVLQEWYYYRWWLFSWFWICLKMKINHS